jgi:hypothetical protein
VAAPLTGPHAVEESARLLRHYRYAIERLMRAMAGWIALTPELSAKLLLGRHVWDNAQHADLLGRRLPELRARAQESEPPGQGFVAFMDALEAPEGPGETLERLVGAYRVLKPHLAATYERHLGLANPVYEPPTRRVLERCLADEHRHVAAGATILRHLGADDREQARCLRHQEGLWRLLQAAGGVTGEGLPERGPWLPSLPPDPEALEFIRLETRPSPWALPPELAAAVGDLAAALASGRAESVRPWLAPGVDPGAALGAVARVRPTGHAVVACARLGGWRAVKLRLGGPAGRVTLLTRWRPGPEGWRVEVLEPLRAESPPAA